LDGSDPTPASTLYSAPFAISSTSVISAQAYRAGFSDSPVQRVYFNGSVLITPGAVTAGNFSFTWPSDTAHTYQVQVSSNLCNGTPQLSERNGSDAVVQFVHLPPTGRRDFSGWIY
jgi:hypothetical protein